MLLLARDAETRGLYPEGRCSSEDSGLDLRAPADACVPAGQTIRLDLGVRAAHTSGAGFWLLPRSSLAGTPLLMANSVGLIDRNFRGVLQAAVWNRSPSPYFIAKGRSLFQIAAADLAAIGYDFLTEDDPRAGELFGPGATSRGDGGFGSTGSAGPRGAAEGRGGA